MDPETQENGPPWKEVDDDMRQRMDFNDRMARARVERLSPEGDRRLCQTKHKNKVGREALVSTFWPLTHRSLGLG